MKVDIHGEGKNVVLLHGCPVPPESMRAIRERLEGSYRVIVPDLAGLGLDLVASLEVLEKTLRAHGVEQAMVVGHSMGFYRAVQLARSGGIEVTRIAGLGPIAHFTDESLAQYAELADALDAGGLDVAGIALSLWYPSAFLEANAEVGATVRGWFERMGDALVVEALRKEFVGPDLHPTLHEIDVPVYLRVGELDAATPPALARAIADALPDVRLDVVEGAGHFLHDEDRAATLSALEKFLEA